MTGKYLLLAVLATAAFAQDPVSITPYQLLDARSGQAVACSGCSIYTYAAGTNTPLATYTSSTLATPNTNPVLTNSAGYAVNGATVTGIWVGSSCYKFVAKDSSAVTLFTQDNICDRGAVLKALLAGSGGAALVGYKLSATSSTATTVAAKLDIIPDLKNDFGADTTGAADTTAAIQAAMTYSSLAGPSGKCIYGSSGTYKVSGEITMNGNTCLRLDPGATIRQTADSSTIKMLNTYNYLFGGIIRYAIYAPTRVGILISDLGSSNAANYNNIDGTRVYGLAAQGDLLACFKVRASNAASGGAYSIRIHNIWGQFCYTGVDLDGDGYASPSLNAFINKGSVSGEVDNTFYGLHMKNAGEMPVTLTMEGVQYGAKVEELSVEAVISIFGEAIGDPAHGNPIISFSGAARGNILRFPVSFTPTAAGQIQDSTNGGNIYETLDGMTTRWVNGRFMTCLGCSNNTVAIGQTPAAMLSVVDYNDGISNALMVHGFTSVPEGRALLSFNAYSPGKYYTGTLTGAPFAGLFASTWFSTSPGVDQPASAGPVATFVNGNTSSGAQANSSIALMGIYNSWIGGLRAQFNDSTANGLGWTNLQVQSNNANTVVQTLTTGTIASGSTTVTVANGASFVNGMFLYGKGIKDGATVVSGGGTNSLVISLTTFPEIADGTPISGGFIETTFGCRGDGVCGNWIYKTVAQLTSGAIYGGCNSSLMSSPTGTRLARVQVTDLLAPVLGAAPVGGGTISGEVICGYNSTGPASGWHVSAF